MSSKVLLTTKNSPWGIINRPVADNVYKHVINFPDISKRDEFINNELFNGEDYKILFQQAPNRAFVRLGSISGAFSASIEEYPFDTIDTLMNKDTVIVEENILGIKNYYFYSVLSVRKNSNLINYELELDVFFTYWYKINIEGNVNIKRAHYPRQINNVWDSNVHNPNYNRIVEPTKMVEKTSIPVVRKDNNGTIEGKTEDIYNQLKEANNGKLYFAILFQKNLNKEYPIPDIKSQGYTYTAPYVISIYPINFTLKFSMKVPGTGGNAGDGTISMGELSKKLSDTNDLVLGCIITEYNMLDFSFKDEFTTIGSVPWEVNYDETTNTVSYHRESVSTKDNRKCSNWQWGNDENQIEEVNQLYLNFIDYDVLEQYNNYVVDLSQYGYSTLQGLDKEISSWQNNLRNVELSIVNNSEKYIIPHYLLGQELSLTHILSLDIAELAETYQLNNSINQGLYEGLSKTTNSYLSFMDNYSEDYKLHNQGAILSRKIGIGLDIVAGSVGIKKGQPFLATLFAREGITQILGLGDIKRKGYEPKGEGYTTLKDLIFYKYRVGIYCQENMVYGSMWYQYASDTYRYGIDINQILPFNSFKQSRVIFNYIECEDMFNKITNINLSPQIKQVFNASFENGITLWHYRDKDSWKGIINYGEENNEFN